MSFAWKHDLCSINNTTISLAVEYIIEYRIMAAIFNLLIHTCHYISHNYNSLVIHIINVSDYIS